MLRRLLFPDVPGASRRMVHFDSRAVQLALEIVGVFAQIVQLSGNFP